MVGLPLRVKVEVIIVKNNKVCLTEVTTKDNYTFYGFPGGGVEGEDSHEETGRKECLEEVGILVKDISYLGLNVILPATFVKTERDTQYSGIHKFNYMARFDKVDKSILGKDDDALPYRWVTIEEAVRKVSLNRFKDVAANRVEALKKVKSWLEMKPLEKW